MYAPNHLHLLAPGLSFIQESVFSEGLRLPALRTLLARGTRLPLSVNTLEAWLCTAFAISSAGECPVAPYSLRAENSDPGTAFWLKADPVHLRVHGDQLILLDSSMLAIETAEAEAIIATLNQHFKTDGLEFFAPSANNWYCATSKQHLVTQPLAAVTGKNINQYLPEGDDRTQWNSVVNEIQMLLFSHPVNQERENQQKLTINSLWFWGAGTFSKELRSPFAKICSNNLLARGLGIAANIDVQTLPNNGTTYLSSLKPAQDYLLTIESLQKAAQYGDIPGWRAAVLNLEEQWCQPLLRAIKQKRLAVISIYALGANNNSEFKVQRADLWKFWRR